MTPRTPPLPIRAAAPLGPGRAPAKTPDDPAGAVSAGQVSFLARVTPAVALT